MKNFVQEGNVIDCVAGSDGVDSGDVVVIGSMVGIAAADAELGESYALVLGGVFTLAKRTGAAWTVGEKLYWDAAAAECSTVNASSNPVIGVAVAAAEANDATGKVRLNNSF